MQAIYGLLEGLAHLYLVDEQVISMFGRIVVLHVGFQRPIFHEAFEVGQVVVDVDDVGIGLLLQNLFRQCLHELRLARSADACDDLDIGSVD